jgi:uncharacterized protein (TIGR00251 family)
MNCRLKIFVSPGASTEKFRGFYRDALKISLQSPAEKSRANKALIGFMASALELSKKQIIIEAGLKSREKLLRFEGIGEKELMSKIRKLCS